MDSEAIQVDEAFVEIHAEDDDDDSLILFSRCCVRDGRTSPFSFLVIRLQTVHGRKRIKAFVKNFNPDLVFIPNSNYYFKMIGAISYYQIAKANGEQNGHFAFWRRNNKNGWTRFSDSILTYYDTFAEKFEDLMLLLLVKL